MDSLAIPAAVFASSYVKRKNGLAYFSHVTLPPVKHLPQIAANITSC
jgi:hypothetical protein